jgi:hypothetical protein
VKKFSSNTTRVLAIAPSTRGFGFAIVEGGRALVDWGAKFVHGKKSIAAISSLKHMILHYEPIAVVMKAGRENANGNSKANIIVKSISELASTHGIETTRFSRQEIIYAYFGSHRRTKHEVAQTIAHYFPDELGFELPPKRLPWMKEDYRMDIFEAVALALMVLNPNRPLEDLS